MEFIGADLIKAGVPKISSFSMLQRGRGCNISQFLQARLLTNRCFQLFAVELENSSLYCSHSLLHLHFLHHSEEISSQGESPARCDADHLD